MSDTPKVMKVLVINVGTEPIKTEKFEFPTTKEGAELARTTVLATMNRMGKNSETIVRHNGHLIMYSHTSARGPSEKLFSAKINYHPLAELIPV